MFGSNEINSFEVFSIFFRDPLIFIRIYINKYNSASKSVIQKYLLRYTKICVQDTCAPGTILFAWNALVKDPRGLLPHFIPVSADMLLCQKNPV